MTVNTKKLIIWICIGLFVCSLIYILQQPQKAIAQTDIECPVYTVAAGGYDPITGIIYIFTQEPTSVGVQHVILHEYAHYLGMDENQAEVYAYSHEITIRGDFND